MMRKILALAILATMSGGAQAEPHTGGVTAGGLTPTLDAQVVYEAIPGVYTTDEPLLDIPLPGETGFYSHVDFIKFAEACAHLHTMSVDLKNNGRNKSLVCQTEDGGSFQVATNGNEATVAIYQTIQMNGDAITELDDSVSVTVPLSSPIDQKCAEKIMEARSSGNYGDVKIKFNSHVFEATCQDAPATPALSLISSLKAMGKAFW
jgi:hypothetical protein